MKKTFTSVKNFKVINWKEVITNLIKNNDNHDEFSQYAKTWDTCVVGQLSTHIERRNEENSPIDEILDKLGREFTTCFKNFEYEECLNIIELVEIRERQLLSKYRLNLINELSNIENRTKELKKLIKEFN